MAVSLLGITAAVVLCSRLFLRIFLFKVSLSGTSGGVGMLSGQLLPADWMLEWGVCFGVAQLVCWTGRASTAPSRSSEGQISAGWPSNGALSDDDIGECWSTEETGKARYEGARGARSGKGRALKPTVYSFVGVISRSRSMEDVVDPGREGMKADTGVPTGLMTLLLDEAIWIGKRVN